MRKRTNPSCALGAFCVFITLKSGEGRKRWLYPPLENCGRKELNMDRGQAHALLNQLKLGMYVPQGKINEALYVTGDLDVQQIAPRACRALREDGNQSCYVRSSSLEDEGIGSGFNWSMDWNRKRNSNEIEGIKK